MKLKSFGCSFIFGTDLADVNKVTGPPGTPNQAASPSNLTWPALLATETGLTYECYARPGSGNLRILEKVLSMATQEPAVFVIGWTWIDRFDYTTVANPKYHYMDHANNQDLWKTLMPIDRDSKATSYYKELHSEFVTKLTSLVYIKTAIDTLKQKNIKFIMTYMDNLLFDSQWHVNSAVLDLQNYIKPYMTTFDGENFLDYSQRNNFAISDTMHPLEPAHRAACQLIRSYNLL